MKYTSDKWFIIAIALFIIAALLQATAIALIIKDATQPKEFTMSFCTSGFDAPEDYPISIPRCENS